MTRFINRVAFIAALKKYLKGEAKYALEYESVQEEWLKELEKDFEGSGLPIFEVKSRYTKSGHTESIRYKVEGFEFDDGSIENVFIFENDETEEKGGSE